MQFTFHIVGLPHTEVTKEFLPCAYTQKVRNLAIMMKSLGHKVFVYGGGKTDINCDEFIPCLSTSEQEHFFSSVDWKKDFFPIEWNNTVPYWLQFNTKAVEEIGKRIKPKDFILVIGGSCHKPIADVFPDNQTVEPGIGYDGTFSKYRVFESYSHMHNVYGKDGTKDGMSYDCVIPNYFDPADFPFEEKKDDYFLFIGRLVSRKGPYIAAETTRHLGAKLKMAGQGVISNQNNTIVSREITLQGEHIEHIGTVGVKERGILMSKAKAVFVPTYYLEPFGGVAVEAMMCGTPVITTDWGAFTETVLDGITGYRTRTLGEAIWAAENVTKLSPSKIRQWAVDNYSMDRVKYQYQAYFEQLYGLWGKGWYDLSYNPENRRYQRIYPI